MGGYGTLIYAFFLAYEPRIGPLETEATTSNRLGHTFEFSSRHLVDVHGTAYLMKDSQSLSIHLPDLS